MQLSELIERYSIKTVCQRTNISEVNIEYLLNSDFDAIQKVKTLGFISILEREFGTDLKKLREDALAYYAQHISHERITLSLPVMEEKKGSSKWIWVLVLLLLGYASWYFLTKYDQSQLKALLPFNEIKIVDKLNMETPADNDEELSIKHVITEDGNETK